MPRKRMIVPDIWIDEGFIELPVEGRLLFIGLISMADDDGKGRGSAKGLKSQIFPSDETIGASRIEELKAMLAEKMCVIFYRVNGKEYYLLHKWHKHQYISHPQPSTLPNPPKNPSKERSGNDTGMIQERSGNGTEQLINELDNKLINKGAPPSASPTAQPTEVISRPENPENLQPRNHSPTEQKRALAEKLRIEDPRAYQEYIERYPELAPSKSATEKEEWDLPP